jgi:hypothetical protein
VLNLVFSLVQTKDLSKSCSFKEFSISMHLTSGEKRETKRALVYNNNNNNNNKFTLPFIVMSFA